MKARVHIELTARDGTVVAQRDCRNAVMREGARLVADLFAGRGRPITHMGVGTSGDAETEAFTTGGLANLETDGAPALAGGTETAIPPEAFQAAEVDETKRLVRVRVRATLPATAAVGTLREAGLLSRGDDGAVLYNRVTFAPMTKGGDHELTMFWEITFPYGDLQWLL
jgi:hypothetical protein